MGKKTIDDAEIGELLGRIPADSALGSCGDNEQVGEGWMIPIGKRLRALVERMNRAERAAKSLGDALRAEVEQLHKYLRDICNAIDGERCPSPTEWALMQQLARMGKAAIDAARGSDAPYEQLALALVMQERAKR